LASRGHHADIGGITPGSMPPHSKLLSEEGAAFKSFKIVSEGKFREEELTAVLTAAGTRNLQDNLADLHAQIAANQKVMNILHDLKCFFLVHIILQVNRSTFHASIIGNHSYPGAGCYLRIRRRPGVHGAHSV